MSLYQPIAVEQDTVTLRERDLSLFIAHPLHDPEWHPPGPEFLGFAITVKVRQVVASVSIPQGSALRLEDGIEAGDEHVWRDAANQRLVDLGEYLPRRR